MPLPFKKRKLSELKNAEDVVDTGGSGSLTAPTGTNSGGSSSSPTKSNGGVVSSSSTATTGNNYEVFLSFRGLDTRNSFADHLYRGLIDAGIRAFRDDEELRHGEKIGLDLLTAIKNGKISIPILSENYGSSKWCLDELVQIMECKNSNTGHIVLPIFYKVAPGDVRHQIGKFGEAFHERERRSLERDFDPRL
ncbi:uncharacterized protein J3R85_014840 [Psidium guajava]|nr:uncharacterized protein J3R85_014840 [Psidium guajava]